MSLNTRNHAGHAAVAAALMLLYGWLFKAIGISGSDFYNAMVDLFFWTLRIGGLILALGAALCAAGTRWGLLVDFAAGGACGLIMALYAISGAIAGLGIGLQDLIILVFAVGLVHSSLASLRTFLAERAPSKPRMAFQAKAPSPDAAPAHPASIHPESLPEEGDAAPPEGYLAALSKEKDEPPTASFE